MQGSESPRVSIPLDNSHNLLHPYNTTLVTCRGKNEEINVMAVAWIIPVSVDPPLIVMSIRPQRYSFNLIRETRCFVVNIPTFELARKVLLCGRRSGREHKKFEEASLTPLKAEKVDAPIIKECVAHLECKLRRTIEAGDHSLIIGEVVASSAVEGFFEEIYEVTKFSPCLHLGKNFFTTWIKEKIEPEI